MRRTGNIGKRKAGQERNGPGGEKRKQMEANSICTFLYDGHARVLW